MQGKITPKKRFAIEPSLGDLQLFGSHVRSDLHPLAAIVAKSMREGVVDLIGHCRF